MNDVFFEQIVKKKDSIKDKLIKACILLVALFLFFMLMYVVVFTRYPTINSIAFLLAVGSLVGAWYFISGLNLEFEYIYTNGEIDIDKISAKRKRKRVTTVRISSFELFEEYNHDKYKSEHFDVKIYACTHMLDENVYSAVYRGKQGEKCLLVFSPNERLLTEINKIYKRKVHSR
ncbi:hypothetical protein RBG61_08995 [Paludicola sp. MB14-C6]|uniref:hypothetical protein n=1 Tax=Paludihabitans sp. MB14-C6 TaxID=3070656 RepID=UPI0027DDA9D9|nr:hypothetical protein [Paludicola sp. MB14-C6]WMJ22136.1 hypothetical protein RBG61_08995 [Paludicola sp. MB14-C6]